MTQFKTIGVVGAMGSEIAIVFALSGRQTSLSDPSRETADAAKGRKDGRGWHRHDDKGKRL